jgi:hypothetical protein
MQKTVGDRFFWIRAEFCAAPISTEQPQIQRIHA